MGNFIFATTRGRARHLSSLPGTNDGLLVVLLEATGIEADDVMEDYTSLGALLAASNNEQTTMGRKPLTTVVIEPDAANRWVDYNCDDVTWLLAAGNPVAALIICYDPDTTASSDANIIPMYKWDFSVAPNGNDTVAMIAPDGYGRTK